MGNKYQEALDEVIKTEVSSGCACCYEDDDVNVFDKDDESIEILQELVDRATPKKGERQAEEGFRPEAASHMVCPTCEKPIVNVWNVYAYKPKFCHYCGQALDWEEYNNG